MTSDQKQSVCCSHLCQHPVCWQTCRSTLNSWTQAGTNIHSQCGTKNDSRWNTVPNEDYLPCISILNLGQNNKTSNQSDLALSSDESISHGGHWESLNRGSLIEITPAPANTPLQSSHGLAEIKTFNYNNHPTKIHGKTLKDKFYPQSIFTSCTKITLKVTNKHASPTKCYNWTSSSKTRKSGGGHLPNTAILRDMSTMHTSRINLPECINAAEFPLKPTLSANQNIFSYKAGLIGGNFQKDKWRPSVVSPRILKHQSKSFNKNSRINVSNSTFETSFHLHTGSIERNSSKTLSQKRDQQLQSSKLFPDSRNALDITPCSLQRSGNATKNLDCLVNSSKVDDLVNKGEVSTSVTPSNQPALQLALTSDDHMTVTRDDLDSQKMTGRHDKSEASREESSPAPPPPSPDFLNESFSVKKSKT